MSGSIDGSKHRCLPRSELGLGGVIGKSGVGVRAARRALGLAPGALGGNKWAWNKWAWVVVLVAPEAGAGGRVHQRRYPFVI